MNFEVDSGLFADTVCPASCEKNAFCKAWTLVKAGIQGPKARCWLKNTIPAKSVNSCCTSGVPARALELGVDRPGWDYKGVKVDNAFSCHAICHNDSSCAAWTWVRSGFQGQGSPAMCYLKKPVPDAVPSNCCTSGVADHSTPPG